MGGIGVGGSLGKSTSNTKHHLPPPTPEEKELTRAILDLAEIQLGNLDRLSALADESVSLAEPLFRIFANDLALGEAGQEVRLEQIQRSLDQARTFGDASQRLLDFQLETIERGGEPSPAQQARIERLRSASLSRAESDIDRVTQQEYDRLTEEFAPSAGLRRSDTPIVDRGGEIAEEAIRQKAQAAREADIFAATQEIQLPLAEASTFGSLAAGQQQLVEGARQFSETLALQDFLARQQLASGVGNLNLGAAQASASGVGPFAAGLATLQQPRLAAVRVQNKSRGKQFGASGNVQLTSSDVGNIAFLAGACWVAAVYFGWGTPRWIAARRWILFGWQGPVAVAFRAVYLRHGERIAGWVRRSRALRAALRPVFNWAARKGA